MKQFWETFSVILVGFVLVVGMIGGFGIAFLDELSQLGLFSSDAASPPSATAPYAEPDWGEPVWEESVPEASEPIVQETQWDPHMAYIAPYAEELREEISTIEEATAFLDERFPELMMSAHTHTPTDPQNYWWLSSGAETVSMEPPSSIGRSNVVHALTYLLGDDMPIYTVIGFAHAEYGGVPMRAINCIETENGYEFIDPVKLMRGDWVSRYGVMLPEASVSSFDEYVALCKENPGIALCVDYLYLFTDSERFEFVEDEQGLVTLIPRKNCQLLWDNTAWDDLTPVQAHQLETDFVTPENIRHFDLYNCLGGVTLTPEEARALVYAKPEAVKEQVKTAADLLMYMLAANIKPCDGCYCDNWGGDVWHTNMNARQVIQSKLGNCGSCANLANYLLEGDYEEVGYVDHVFMPGGGGSHVYNYLVYEGKYYIVDFSDYMFNFYLSNPAVRVVDSLEAWGDALRQGIDSWVFNNICLVSAYTSTGQQLPCIFDEDRYWDTGEANYYFPEGAEYTLIYDAGEGYKMAEKPFNKAYYDWDVFWGAVDRAPKQPAPGNDFIPMDNPQPSEPVSYADPGNISRYDLSKHLGGTTMTPDEARALVDAEPEKVKEQVKTAADLLMYMLAANIQPCDGCYCDNWGGDVWHTNMNARQVMQTNLGNCGSCANLANYLLEGDYEEVGFMDHALFPGYGGSHVYNYIFHEGKYYIVDFSYYLFNRYNPACDWPIPVMDALEEWSEIIKGEPYNNRVNTIISYTSTGQQLPCIFGENDRYYLPKGAEYTVLYQSPVGYQLAEKSFNKIHYDWNVFWGETDREPKNPA